MDSLDVHYHDPHRVSKAHQEMIDNAHICITTATKIYEESKKLRSNVLLAPNAVDYDHFKEGKNRRQFEIPNDLKIALDAGKPLILYYGALAKWVDYNLIRYAAQTKREFLFVLIGPDHDGTFAKSGIQHEENVLWLRPKSYEELPRYLAYADVCMIPFEINNITLATSPIKLFEYMAAGKPVITTDLPECRKYPPVLIAQDRQEFVTKLDQGLKLRHNQEYLEAVDSIARENSWEARVQQIIVALEDLTPTKIPEATDASQVVSSVNEAEK
jgi:glycosyltransferase involved in cell wall biosynthesis